MGKTSTKSGNDGTTKKAEKATYDISDYVDYEDVTYSTAKTSAVTTTGRSYVTDLVSNSGSSSINSRSNSDTISIGQTFIAGLLEEPRK